MSGSAIAPRIEAGAGVTIDPEGRISTSGAAVTAEQFAKIPTATTTSLAMTTLFTLPVTVDADGDVLADFRASVQFSYLVPGAQVLGGAFQFLWDGAATPDGDVSFCQIDPDFGPPNIATFAQNVTLRARIPATAGPHTLEVQWQVLDANNQADIFPSCADVTVQGI